ncbi:MOSC domain-containing protein [Vibrio sp. SCSIO 43137]|uniref:MOSC domain-containing protein n=1 Tax=Vibrio sp. SCSIO 43137 TaxID=3021011 RepID=UPI00230829DA|nr:MOSC domain-containing protein [Vibrio sp. SCSIO 43137]WCE32206.1 MOSC domain-containing protein [Vibrio sp. SCSIO 43137]
MKKIGVINAVLTGKTESFAHGSQSAINKKVASGRQQADSLGFIYDEQGDPRFHGGVHKAIHIYPSEHYADWQNEIGEKSALKSVGAFGENLSCSGITESAVCLKDKIRIGSTLLEVSQGRMPCWKLNVRFEQNDMAQRLQDTLRTGWYFRVLEEGEIGSGDEIFLCERPYPKWSLSRIMSAIFTGCLDNDELSQLADIPLEESWHRLVINRLEKGVVENWQPRLVGPTGEAD